MDLGWVLAVSGFALAMAGTPGPNNTIVTASGANHGLRRTLPLIAGITTGVALIILAVAAVGTSIVGDPRIQLGLKWVGLAYLLWLAWRIGSATPAIPGGGVEGETQGKPLTLLQGALFQLVNPKLWVIAAGGVVTYGSTAQGASPAAIGTAFALIFAIATTLSTVAWTLIGLGVGRFLRTDRAMRLFNWTMAALLIASLFPVMIGG